MSIYKVKFRCTKCSNLWIEDAPVTTVMDQVCPACGGNILTLSLYNDSIANIDDEKIDDEKEDET